MVSKVTLIVVAFFWTSLTFAQWSTYSNLNSAICTAVGDQVSPAIVSDGAGGAIIPWQDSRSGTSDIYAQKINAAGTVQWAANGVAICTAANDQLYQSIVSDGVGGAIIAWSDFRNGTDYDIYAQKINAAGTIQWAANGVAICTAANYQLAPTIASDGAGGAIIAWHDARNGNTNYDIYTQKINAAGAVQWAANGVAICTASNNQFDPITVSDGAGGAIIAWADKRRSTSFDIYAQKISGAGTVQWTANGVAICTVAGSQQEYPNIGSDGTGGAIITWNDLRSGTNNDIYAQKINTAGTVQWTANGAAICTAAGDQLYPNIATDGVGGAIFTWQDLRGGNDNDIYAQQIGSDGTVQWTANGVAICTAAGDQLFPSAVIDGTGGAIITWYDFRSGSNDIYAQRISAAGAGTVQWAANGVAVCTAAGDQLYPAILSIGSSGAIITWQDLRNGINNDIYAQKVDLFGIFGTANPSLVSVRDIPGDQGRQVRVLWNRSSYDQPVYNLVSYYSIWRGVRGTLAPDEAKIVSPSAMRPDFSGEAYRIIASPNDVATVWEWIANVPIHNFATYSFVAPTLSDSTASGTPYYGFFVSAQGLQPNMFWDSQVDSGYSVDNLPPGMPRHLSGSFVAPVAVFHWNPNTERDLAGYKIYRSGVSGFDPDTMTAYASTGDTAYTDMNVPLHGNWYYAIRAYDVHDNYSPKSNEVGIILLGIDDINGTPGVFLLSQNYPNPFNPTTTLRYDLPTQTKVTVNVYNVLGQEVATLLNETKTAGRYRVEWNATGMASGVYWCRLQAGDFTQMKKLILLR